MLLADGQLTPVASAGPEQWWRRQRRRLSTLIFFGVGALTSSMLGGLTLLGLRAPNAAEAVAAVPPAISAPEVVDVAIERGERERTALGVRVEGAEGADTEVVLRGIPVTAELSRGERRDALTWVVKQADLDGLYLTLGNAGPDAFDMRIDVLAASGVARQAGVVRIRLVDAPPQKQASAQLAQESPREEAAPSEAQDKAAPAETTIAKLPAPTAVADRTPQDAADAKVASPPPAPRRANANPAVAKTTPAARPWPEGASGLGAVSRDSERQVWWSVPPAPWSPFETQ